MYFKIPFTPIEVHAYGDKNWSFLKASLVTGKEAGLVQRETAIQAGFKSEHLLEVVGEDNPADIFTAADGITYLGKIWRSPNGDGHSLTARQVAARAIHQASVKAAAKQAAQVAVASQVASSNGASAPATPVGATTA